LILFRRNGGARLAAALAQIVLLDIVFSVSIITAVGMTNGIPIMVTA
jgi:predicted tellurium resistance membrane protein TerC